MKKATTKIHGFNVRTLKTYCGKARSVRAADVTLIREETTCRNCIKARRAWAN